MQAGYPASQYEAAAALLDGSGTERDEQAALVWLRQASQAGQPEALLAEARLVRNGLLPGGADEAERLLLRAMPRLNEAHFELGELYMELEDPRKWIAALGLVQAAYEAALTGQDGALADRCLEASPEWLAKLDRLSRNGSRTALSSEELTGLVMIRFMFDEQDRPCVNRRERMRLFYEKARAASALGSSRTADKQQLIRQLASGVLPASSPAMAARRPMPLPPVTVRVAQAKVSRNQPCPCGSGRKSKVCCS